MNHFGRIGTLVALACTGLAATTHADTLTPIAIGGNLILSQSWTSTASGQTPTTATGTGINGDGAGVGVSDLTASGTGGSYQFSQTFTGTQGSFSGGNINGNGYGFIASYVIDVSPSMANAYVFSLNLSSQVGLQNLTARLYEYNANGVQNLVLGTPGPLPNGGVMDSWSASVNPTSQNPVASTTLPTTNLTNGGEFVLEIAGITTGTSSGTYSGQLDITPVPLPAALPLLLSALGGLGCLARRRANI